MLMMMVMMDASTIYYFVKGTLHVSSSLVLPTTEVQYVAHGHPACKWQKQVLNLKLTVKSLFLPHILHCFQCLDRYLLQFQFLELTQIYLVPSFQDRTLLLIHISRRCLLNTYHVPCTILVLILDFFGDHITRSQVKQGRKDFIVFTLKQLYSD